MKKKMFSGFLALVLTFSNFANNVVALSAELSITNISNSNNLFANSLFDDSASSSTSSTSSRSNSLFDDSATSSTSSTSSYSNSLFDDSASSSSNSNRSNSLFNDNTSSDLDSSSGGLFGSDTSSQTSSNTEPSISNFYGISNIADEQDNSQTPTQTNNVDTNRIMLNIDTTNLTGFLLSDITLPIGVTAEVYESETATVLLLSQRLGMFIPMSITYGNVSNLISNTTGYIGSGNDEIGGLSTLDATQIENLYFHIPISDDNRYTYDSTKVGIANFQAGYMPIFATSDFINSGISAFTNTDITIEFSGWKFSDSVTVYNGSNIVSISDNFLSVDTNFTSVEILGGTYVTAQFTTSTTTTTPDTTPEDEPTQTSLSGKVSYTSSYNTIDFTDLIVELTGSTMYNKLLDSDGSYYFDNIPTGTYTISVTGNGIENYTKSINISGDSNTENITVSPKKYSLSYLAYNTSNGLYKGVNSYTYESGETATIPGITTAFLEYLEDKSMAFDKWYVYVDDTTKTSADPYDYTLYSDNNIIKSDFGTSGVSLTMPALDLYFAFDTKYLEESYTVEFYDSSEASVIKTQEGLELGDTITSATVSTIKGYKFTGWYTNSDCTTLWDFTKEITADDFSSTKTMRLYAGWEGNSVNVVVDYYGATNTSGQFVDLKVGDQITLYSGTKTGNAFDYWLWWNNNTSGYTYSLSDYITPNISSSNASLEIPPLDEGNTLYINANWTQLSTCVLVSNIEDAEYNGNSCYVAIYNPDYGTLYGEYVSSYSSTTECYKFDLESFGTGMYTVEVSTKSGQEMSSVIYATDENSNIFTVELLPSGKATTVTNSANNVINVGSTNLADQFTTSELFNSDNVTITMDVSGVSSTSTDANLILDSLNSYQTVGLFLDVTLNKNDGVTKSTMQPYSSKGLNVVVELSDGFQDQQSYFVATVHDGEYSTLNSSKVSYDADSNSISFYTTELSVFGIGYSSTSTTTSLVSTYIPTADGYYVPIFQNVMLGQWIEGLGIYELIHPDPTNWKFVGWYFGETGVTLSQEQLDTHFVVTQGMLDYGIFPLFAQIVEDSDLSKSPVPQTGVTSLANLF